MQFVIMISPPAPHQPLIPDRCHCLKSSYPWLMCSASMRRVLRRCVDSGLLSLFFEDMKTWVEIGRYENTLSPTTTTPLEYRNSAADVNRHIALLCSIATEAPGRNLQV